MPDDVMARAAAIYAAELRATAPKGEYVARTVLAAPTDADQRVFRAIAAALTAGEHEGIRRAAEVAGAASFLVARIDDLDWCDFDDLCRDWAGHVDPALYRLKALLPAPVEREGSDG